MVHTKIYVIECATPNFFYVGSTFRELYDRLDEHECMFGSRWTRRHGFNPTCLVTRARFSKTI